MSHYFSSLLTIILVSNLFFSIPMVNVLATSSAKDIKFAITKVVKEGKDLKTEGSNSSFNTSDALTAADAIKYQWEGLDINTKYKNSPAKSGGYLKVYLGDETKDDNFLIDAGTDNYPLKLNSFAPKLNSGKNTLVFVLIDGDGQKTNRTTFTFNYQGDSAKPKITVTKPLSEGAPFAKGVAQIIQVELDNFKLTTLKDKPAGFGKLNIYANSLDNLIGSMNSATEVNDTRSRVDILPEALSNFDKLPDSKDTKLIFQLVGSNDNEIVATQEFKITTNYGGTIATTYPTIKFLDPSKESAVQPVGGDRKFLTDIKNFEILSKPPLNNSDKPDDKKGFFQIFIDNKPIQTMWPKPDFTLNEIGYTSNENGEKEVKVQLVNGFFSKLVPEATEKIKIQYVSASTQEKKSVTDSGVQNNNWKIIILVLTVILVIGGILISITRA